MVDRLSVQVLRKAGLPVDEVARQVGVSPRSVKRIAKEPRVAALSPGPSPPSRGAGRPSTVEAFRPALAELLATDPSLATVELLRRARERGYRGGKSALYDLVKVLRPREVPPLVVRFEGVPGEFSQHDFGHTRARFMDDSFETVTFFASRLKYSRWAHVVEVADEKVEALLRALLAAFEDFGGVPLASVFDNPKTIVVSRTAGKPNWNRTFGQAALDYGFAPLLCTPRRPQEKGAAENLVGWTKSGFYQGRRFVDREDRRAQLAAWLAEGNTQRPSRATGVPPAARIGAERERLRPLAIPPADYALPFAVVVRTTGLVEHAGIRYSMPPAAAGIPATLFLGPDRVRILTTNGLEAEHPRTPEAGTASYRTEDRAARLAAVHGARGRLYLQRQEIFELGPPAEALITEWVHGGQYNWKNQVEALHPLLALHGAARVLAAIVRALADHRCHADAIAWLLDHPSSRDNNNSLPSSSEGLA
jgi:transposase